MLLSSLSPWQESLLLGTYEWRVYNDSRECSIEESYTAVLTLSGCGEDQFRRYSDNS